MVTLQQSEHEKSGQTGSLSLSFDVQSLVQGIRVKPAEFARMCGCSRQTVSRWVKEGMISLFLDGTLDPQAAAKSVLGKRDPRRMKAAVFRDLATSSDDLRKQIKAISAELGGTRQALAIAKDDVEFHEGAASELMEIAHALPAAIAGEWLLLSSLDGDTVAELLAAWRDFVLTYGLTTVPSFAELLETLDENARTNPGARLTV